MSKRLQQGFTLVELLTVIAIVGVIVAAAVPAFSSHRRRSAVRTAAEELRTIFHAARSRAITRSHNVGIKFTEERGEWQYALYDDRDGDGVRNDDIKKGTDVRITVPRPVLSETGRIATIGLLPKTMLDPDGDKLTPGKSSPVQFNRSTICSFSPIGESTPGTIFVTDRAELLFAVRVYGASARMTVLRYDASTKKWVAP